LFVAVTARFSEETVPLRSSPRDRATISWQAAFGQTDDIAQVDPEDVS
jgi:hypothetical protein